MSGGEQAKVRLCKLINRETNVLLLDEPTNHLDVDAKEELARALKAYKGSILLICHEPEFYEGLCYPRGRLQRILPARLRAGLCRLVSVFVDELFLYW